MSDAVMVPSSWVKILRLIAEGHPVEAHEDQFIVVQNPDFQPDMNDPNFVIDTHALAASPSVGGWEDISTAPKDGTNIDLWCRDVKTGESYRFPDSYWCWDRQQWHGCDEYIWPEADVPTHWMPLPPPPSVSTGSRPQEAVHTEQAAPTVVSGWDREICTGCTASLSIADIKARGIVSCCPDRHMVRIGDLVDAYTARPPRILPQTEKGSTTPPVKTGEG